MYVLCLSSIYVLLTYQHSFLKCDEDRMENDERPREMISDFLVVDHCISLRRDFHCFHHAKMSV